MEIRAKISFHFHNNMHQLYISMIFINSMKMFQLNNPNITFEFALVNYGFLCSSLEKKTKKKREKKYCIQFINLL
jgi:hypothetical protein